VDPRGCAPQPRRSQARATCLATSDYNIAAMSTPFTTALAKLPPPDPKSESFKADTLLLAGKRVRMYKSSPFDAIHFKSFDPKNERTVAFVGRYHAAVVSLNLTDMPFTRLAVIKDLVGPDVSLAIARAATGTAALDKKIQDAVRKNSDYGILEILELLHGQLPPSPVAQFHDLITVAYAGQLEDDWVRTRAATEEIHAQLKTMSADDMAAEVMLFRLPKDVRSLYLNSVAPTHRNAAALADFFVNYTANKERELEAKRISSTRNIAATSSTSSAPAPTTPTPTPTPTSNPTSDDPPGPCKYCKGNHWNAQCPKRPRLGASADVGSATSPASPPPRPPPTSSAATTPLVRQSPRLHGQAPQPGLLATRYDSDSDSEPDPPL
jgi:hypothetical protein